MANSGVSSYSRDQLIPPPGVTGPRTRPGPPQNVPSRASADPLPNLQPCPVRDSLTRADFFDLFTTLPNGSILFPGCKAYSQAIFIGNLLYDQEICFAVVQATTVEDVTATVKFASKKRIKLSIKSGGHSAGGYCLNEGGIVLDISSMNDVHINHKDVASVGGGAVWNDVYQCAKKKDPQLVAIGGNCPSVGVSGFLLGGGASPYSRNFGLGIDNLLEMTIVTADGEKVILKPNETDKRKIDLFWAVRGGGGGNFGITVHVKIQLRRLNDKDGTIVSGNLTWKLDPGSEQEREFKAMMEYWNNTTWPPEVRGDALWHYDKHDQLLGKMTMVYNGNWADCIKAIWHLLRFHPQIEMEAMHWTDWEAIDGKVDVFERKYQHHTSFIFEEGGITSEVTDIITKLMREDLITKYEDVDCAILWHHIGSATTNHAREDTAFYWRDGVYVFHVRMLWGEESQSHLQKEIYAFFAKVRAQLQCHALDGKAAYVNFIDPTVKNWGDVYYGKHFKRLCDVKKEWDPTGFFSFPQGIPPSNAGSNGCQSQEAAVSDEKSWTKYAFQSTELLGHPRTVDDVFAMDARLRRANLNIH